MLLDFSGMDFIRGRDLDLFIKGDVHTFALAPEVIAGGFVGGQILTWATNPKLDFPTMGYSSGLYGSFCLWGSNEQGDKYTAMTGQQLAYGYVVAMSGRAVFSTVAYEKYTYASRVGGGPLVPLVYTPSALLYVSKRGYWSCEDELSLTSDPLAPGFYAGFVAQIPKANNQFRLGVQSSM